MEKSERTITFQVVQNKDRRGWRVHVSRPNRPPLDIDFTTEAEAEAWVKKDSAAWLQKLNAGKHD